MRSQFLNLCLTAGVLFGALASAAPGQASLPHSTRRHAPTRHAQLRSRTVAPSSLLQIGLVTEGHVYLTDDGSFAPVDVTNTLYSLNGQVYAVLNGVSIAIVLDANSGTVYNTSGRSIGFIGRAAKPVDTTLCAFLSSRASHTDRDSLL